MLLLTPLCIRRNGYSSQPRMRRRRRLMLSCGLPLLLRATPAPPLQEESKINEDSVSHHILRLAYAGSEENRRWFREQETALFKFRLETETPEQLADFMSRNQLKFVQVRGCGVRRLRLLFRVAND